MVPHQRYRATYRQLWEQTGIVARAFLARGVKKGDRLGLWSPNRFEWVATQYAAARLGAILVNLNPAYRTHELEHALRRSVRGGENVYPREVEEFLYTRPEIAEVQVIGVPDLEYGKYGEELMAWVKLRPGAAITDTDLRAFCRGKIAPTRSRGTVKFVDSFPMTVTGKVQKYRMREAAIAELGLDAAAHVKTA